MNRELSPEEKQRFLALLENEWVPPVAEVEQEHATIMKAHPVTAPGYRFSEKLLEGCYLCCGFSATNAESGWCVKHNHVVRLSSTCKNWRSRR